MVRRLVTVLAISLLLIAMACEGEQSESTTGDTSAAKQSISLQPEIEAARKTYEPEALNYLEAALDTIEMHYILGPDYDWEELRLVVLERAVGDRVMYGSDQMVWPQSFEMSIEAIRSAPFLSDQQKRDILYNNAARFLRLSEEEIAQHHER